MLDNLVWIALVALIFETIILTMVVVRAKKELRKHELLNQEIIDKNNEAKEELQVKVRKLTELNARIDILNAQEV